MKNDGKRMEESTFTRWGKSIANVFKTTKKVEVEKREPEGPSINLEALTAQKREWIDSQAAQVQQTLATWPEHLFEHFFVIGLPPDIEVTQIAQDLWAQEVRQRQDGVGEQNGAGGASSSASGVGGSISAAGSGGRPGSKPQQYDKAPRPAYDAQVLFRHPAAKVAPLSDQELVDLCFPHKVAPVKLRRSPSMSSLHEVVYGRHAAARDDQCFIFLLKVGTSLPLYGICCAVPEMLHRPPHLARHLFPACRMPFRSVMIAAPRVYCLLSHYPFFDLHFQVLNVILGMERLHRTIDFNAELDSASAAPSASAAAAAVTAAAAAVGGGMGIGRAAATGVAPGKGGQQPLQPLQSHHGNGHPHQQQHQHQQRQNLQQQQRDAVRLISRCYCADCAIAIADMYPGLMATTREPEPLRHSRSGRPSTVARLLDDPWVAPTAATLAAAATAALAAPPGGAELPGVRTHGSVRRLSDPGSSGLPSPRVDPGAVTAADLAAAAELRHGRRQLGNSSDGGTVVSTTIQSPDGALREAAAIQRRLAPEYCQACGRALGLGAGPPPVEEMPTVPEQGLLEEATEALENALDKLVSLPRAVAASVTEAATAAAVALRRVSPSAAAVHGGGGLVSEISVAVPAVGCVAAADNEYGGGGRMQYPHSDSFLSSDMGTPHGALASSSASMTARALVVAPAEAVSNMAHKVRDSLKALGSNGSGRLLRSGDGVGGSAAADGGGGGFATATAAAAAAVAEQPDGLYRACPEQAAFINVAHSPSPPAMRRSALPLLEGGTGGGGGGPPLTRPVPLLPAWHSSAAALGGLDTVWTQGQGQGPGSDPRAVSLVQQLMRSVMVPLSPGQGANALAASEPHAAGGRGLSSGVNSAIQSPELPSSPRMEADALRQQQQQQNQQSAGRATSARQLAPAPAFVAAAGDACSSTAAAAAAGYNPSWGFLQRLGRMGSLTRSPGREASPRWEKGRSEGGALATSPSHAGPNFEAAGGGGGGRPVSGERPQGMASAFATAVDLAAAVEQQIASPRTPLVYDAAAAAAQLSDDWRLSSQLPQQAGYDDAADGGSGGGSKAAPLAPRLPPLSPLPPTARVAEFPGGCHSPETASQYASLPHSGPASRRGTAPGDAPQGRADGDVDGAAVAAAAEPPPRQLQPPLVAAATARLMAEHSGFSANPSDASFYSAEGVDEDCTPREHAAASPAADAAALPGDAAEAAPSSSALGDTHAAAAAAATGRACGGGGHSESHLSVEVSAPPQYGSGGGAAVPVMPRARATASVPLLPLGPHASMAAARAAAPCSAAADGVGAGGGGANGTTALGRGSLHTAGMPPPTGPSRLARTSASFALGLGASIDVAAFSPPQPPAAPAAVPQQQALTLSATRSGGGGGGAAPPPAPLTTVLPHHSSGGMVSPPPAGVGVNVADMTHHFSPRRALDQLYDHPLVHPGEQVTLRFGGVATLSYTRPVLGRRFTVVGPPRAIQSYAEAELAEGLQHWTTAVLCRSLSLDNLLLVLTAALLERQVVVFCPHISVLSCCVLGLLSLLRPFGWQSLLLPVTPASMMGFLEAPVPFVLGVQYKTSDVMARCSHLIRVNVYKDQVKNAGAPLPQLPGLKRLAAALAPHHTALRRRLGAHQAGVGGTGASGHGGGSGGVAPSSSGLGTRLGGGATDVPVDGGRSLRSLSPAELSATSSFLSILAHHLGAICGDLRPHVITNVGLSKRTGVLMKESLMEVVPPRDKAFVRQFVETQMFSVWSDALISANFEGSFAAH